MVAASHWRVWAATNKHEHTRYTHTHTHGATDMQTTALRESNLIRFFVCLLLLVWWTCNPCEGRPGWPRIRIISSLIKMSWKIKSIHRLCRSFPVNWQTDKNESQVWHQQCIMWWGGRFIIHTGYWLHYNVGLCYHRIKHRSIFSTSPFQTWGGNVFSICDRIESNPWIISTQRKYLYIEAAFNIQSMH